MLGGALTFATPSHGDDALVAVQKALDAFCGLNLRYIEAAVSAAQTEGSVYHTKCRVVSYREGLMLLFTADEPVFRVPAARKAWAIVVVATAGKTIRDLGGSLLGINYVGLTDRERAQSGKIARLSASYAEQLQAAVHDGKIDADVAMDRLDRRLQFQR